MKKTYLKPATELVVVELQNIIAASPLDTNGGSNKLNSEGATGEAMSRGDYDWDD